MKKTILDIFEKDRTVPLTGALQFITIHNGIKQNGRQQGNGKAASCLTASARIPRGSFFAGICNERNDDKMNMINLLEALMIVCFGLSWPISIYRSYVSRTAKGKSLFFEVFIWIGYIFGILRKVLEIQAGGDLSAMFYVGLFFYILNITEVTIDMMLYFRNTKLDRLADLAVAAE